jgi:hypothetical protein
VSSEVWAYLDPAAADWLRAACADVRRDPHRVRALFPAVGRHCGRAPLVDRDARGLVHGTVDDACRVVLLAALPLTGEELAHEFRELYGSGDAAERRAVVRGLSLVDRPPGCRVDLTDLLHDALRTNDRRLVAAALGPPARWLHDHDWRHGVLKCLSMDVPLAAVAELDTRADPELARMLLGLAHERIAAGRDVPPDVWLVLDRFPGLVASSALPGELDHPVPARRHAARRALSGRLPSDDGRGG